MKNTNMDNFFAQKMINNEPKSDCITYGELAEKVGTMVLCNDVDRHYWDSLEYLDKNGSLSKEAINFVVKDYQWYIITKEAAEYLKSNTDELVYYDKELDVYAWGITIGYANTDWRNKPLAVKKYGIAILV